MRIGYGGASYRRSTMGISERRRIKELQDGTIRERTKEIEEICGKAIPYEVDMSIAFDNGVLEMRCAYALRTDAMYSDGEIRLVHTVATTAANEADVEQVAGECRAAWTAKT
jgi:hypothetical protein